MATSTSSPQRQLNAKFSSFFQYLPTPPVNIKVAPNTDEEEEDEDEVEDGGGLRRREEDFQSWKRPRKVTKEITRKIGWRTE